MTAADIARTFLGVPFLHQGRSERGLDCVGLLVLVFRALGYPVADLEGYSRNPHHGLLVANLEANGAVPVDEPQVGDIAVIAFTTRNGEPVWRHVGIVGDDVHGGLSLIHACSSVGFVTEHRLDSRWRDRCAFYRMGAVSTP